MFKKLGLTIKEYRTNKIFRFFVGLITILVAQICCGLYFRNLLIENTWNIVLYLLFSMF